MISFDLQRLGQIMEPEPGNPMEVEGVLNPAAANRYGLVALLQITLLPPLTVWIVQSWAGCSATKKTLS